MMAESPLTSVDFMSDGGTLAVGSTRGIVVFVRCFVFVFVFVSHMYLLSFFWLTLLTHWKLQNDLNSLVFSLKALQWNFVKLIQAII